jgi:SmpA/OmlA family protein
VVALLKCLTDTRTWVSTLYLRNLILWAALWAMILLAGCANTAGMTAAKLDDVRAGMTREEVLAILGSPQRHETYGSTQFMIYSTDGTSNTALLDFTPIAVVDGRVTGTGRRLYDAVVQAHTKDGASR